MTKTTGRRLMLSLAAVLAILVPAAAPAGAQADNTAVAINTRDGSSIFKLAFRVSRVMNDVVDQGNAAVAYSSCDSCETIAVAIQLVLIFSDPEVVAPENVALALNSQCSLCTTVAQAYQYVFTTNGPVHFDAEGNQEIARIRNEVRNLLQTEDLQITEFQQRLDGLMQQLYRVVKDHLVPAGQSGEALQSDPGPADETPGAGPSPGNSPSPTAGSGSSEPAPESPGSPSPTSPAEQTESSPSP